MVTIGLSISGETPTQIVEVFQLLTSNQLIIARLDEIKELILKQGVDQSLVDQIFEKISQNKQKLEDVLET
jgi:hypothetical protein